MARVLPSAGTDDSVPVLAMVRISVSGEKVRMARVKSSRLLTRR